MKLETLKELKKDSEKKLKHIKQLKENSDVDWHLQGWYSAIVWLSTEILKSIEEGNFE